MIKHTAFFMINIWIRISALSVLLCILVGAYASHGITSQFTMSNLNIYWTTVIYHLFHSISLLLVALFNNSFKKQFYVHLICICFLLGIIFFCGSLYLLVLKKYFNLWIFDSTRRFGLYCRMDHTFSYQI